MSFVNVAPEVLGRGMKMPGPALATPATDVMQGFGDSRSAVLSQGGDPDRFSSLSRESS